MLGVEIVGGRFTLIDTIQFKKGHIIHGFNIQNVSRFQQEGQQIRAKMLIVVAYNGSKLKEFTFGVNKAFEGRKQRKLPHKLNLRFSIAQVMPIHIAKAKNQSYLVRDCKTS